MRAVTKSRSRVDLARQDAPKNLALSGLSALRDRLPAGPAAMTGTTMSSGESGKAAGQAGASLYSRANKIVLRRERKGHGGKTVTRLEGLSCSAAELDTALREIKRSLGCGAAIEGVDILVQGDQTDRLRAFLESQGAKMIVTGN
jgi:translation initiation factor 1